VKLVRQTLLFLKADQNNFRHLHLIRKIRMELCLEHKTQITSEIPTLE
jgi:hypothetical protein